MRNFLKWLLKWIHLQELCLCKTTSYNYYCTKKFSGDESKNASPAHCNLQFLNTGRCGLYYMIKKNEPDSPHCQTVWTKTAHRPQTNDSVRRRPPTNNSKCPWKCAIENLAKALIKENQTHVKNLLSKIAIVLPATRIQDGYMISKLKGTSLSNTLSKIMSSNTNYPQTLI